MRASWNRSLVCFLAVFLTPAIASAQQSYISETDYPAASAKAGEEGKVTFALDISRTGKVTKCRIVESSGFRRLDRRTCEIVRERARFTPARDDAGKPVKDTFTGNVRWLLEP